MEDRILLAHGSGGRLAHDLVGSCFIKKLANPLLEKLDDAATFEMSGRLAFTTDSYTISPVFFPGGNIGKLAICGTVNDLAMSGAEPRYLSLSLIIEEGLLLSDLKRIAESIRATAADAGVQIITGDTKVVEHGNADGIFINTSGIGLIREGVNISGSNARPGDAVILSGAIGDHGIAILSQREGLSFHTTLESDCAPLGDLVSRMLDASRDIRCLRDPTRGGLATTLNEIADKSEAGIRINETAVPVRDEVAGACEMLGLDPLYIANEGKLVAIVPAQDTDRILAAMRAHPYGREAVVIGEVTNEHPGRVIMRTSLGTSRIVDMLTGDPLPRIC